MFKKNIKKYLSLALSLVLLLTVFSACGGNDSSDVQEPSENEVSQETEVQNPAQGAGTGEIYSDLSFMPDDLRTFYEDNVDIFNAFITDTASLISNSDLVEPAETPEDYRDPNTGIPYSMTGTKYEDFIANLKNYLTDKCIEEKSYCYLENNGYVGLLGSSLSLSPGLDKESYLVNKNTEDTVAFNYIAASTDENGNITGLGGFYYTFVKTADGWRLDSDGTIG